MSPDGKTYTFHLRPGAKWSDGQPVTAKDFVYSFKRLLNPDTAADYASFFTDAGIVGAADYNAGKGSADAVGVRAKDDNTLEIQLEAPSGYFPNLTALWQVPRCARTSSRRTPAGPRIRRPISATARSR